MNLYYILKNNFLVMALYFIIYANLGWVLETVYATIKQKKFINRGFLYGPFCSMYGFGAISIIYILNPFKNNLIKLYLYSVILTTIIEYITGYILEKSFNTTWWDYSNEPFNIKGRICLSFSLIWGGISLILVKFIHPFFENFSFITKNIYGKTLIVLILMEMFIDFIFTLISLSKFKYSLEELRKVYEDFKIKLVEKEKTIDKEKFENAFKEFKQRYENIYSKIHEKYSRYFNAFPKYTLNKTLKNLTIETKEKLQSKFKFKDHK